MASSLDKDEINLEFKKQDIFKEKPIQLIEFKGDQFELNPEALEIINSIEEDILVVAIVGKARTGKSYLMNLLLDNVGNKNKGVIFIYPVSS
jgi:predicted AAA+ superfamily ATPase